MPTAAARFNSVDDYIGMQPAQAQVVLERVRRAIRKALPKSEETISYNIPAYKLQGHAVIYFAGWKRHFSLYPVSKRAVLAFHTELAPYELNKSTVRFPLTEPVPTKLIASLAKFRAQEVAAKKKAAKQS